jgi:hypothetical protein
VLPATLREVFENRPEDFYGAQKDFTSAVSNVQLMHGYKKAHELLAAADPALGAAYVNYAGKIPVDFMGGFLLYSAQFMQALSVNLNAPQNRERIRKILQLLDLDADRNQGRTTTVGDLYQYHKSMSPQNFDEAVSILLNAARRGKNARQILEIVSGLKPRTSAELLSALRTLAARSEVRSMDKPQVTSLKPQALKPEAGRLQPVTEKTRSEVRQTAEEIVNAFETGQELSFDWVPVVPVIRTAGVWTVATEIQTVANQRMAQSDAAFGARVQGYASAIQTLQPTLIEYRVQREEAAQINGVVNAMVAAAVFNKNILGRVTNIPKQVRSELRFQLNRTDGVILEKSGDSLIVRNSEFEGYSTYVSGPAAVTVTDTSNMAGTVLFSDAFVDGQGIYEGPQDTDAAANLFAFSLVIAATPISERTAQGLAQVGTDDYRVRDRQALAMGPYLIQIFTQHLTAQRLERSA